MLSHRGLSEEEGGGKEEKRKKEKKGEESWTTSLTARPKKTLPDRTFRNSKPPNMSIDVSELHKSRHSTDYEALNLQNVWSGNISHATHTQAWLCAACNHFLKHKCYVHRPCMHYHQPASNPLLRKFYSIFCHLATWNTNEKKGIWDSRRSLFTDLHNAGHCSFLQAHNSLLTWLTLNTLNFFFVI